MATLSPSPKMQFFDNNGDPLSGGKLYTYLSGTTTPTFTKTTSTGDVNNTNPVILNARGEASIWLDESIAYRFVLKTSTDVELWTSDGVRGSSVSTSKGRQLFTANGSFTVPIGVSTIYISGVAGGGGGGGGGSNALANAIAGGGGGGGAGESIFKKAQTVVPGEVIAITVGLGGLLDATHGTGGISGGAVSTNGNDGTDTIVGTYLTLVHGGGGVAGLVSLGAIGTGGGSGGAGGTSATVGAIPGQSGKYGNPRGPTGGFVNPAFSGGGGSSLFGEGGREIRVIIGTGVGDIGVNGIGYGSGGSGGGVCFDNPSNGGNGGNGTNGMVLIEW